jgi:hypothetical protein
MPKCMGHTTRKLQSQPPEEVQGDECDSENTEPIENRWSGYPCPGAHCPWSGPWEGGEHPQLLISFMILLG